MKMPLTVADSYTCGRCRKTLPHDKRYCPLFPEVEPPPGIVCVDTGFGLKAQRVPGKKWDRCVCLVHTCYDLAAMRRGR